jgi:hypothetical protein
MIPLLKSLGQIYVQRRGGKFIVPALIIDGKKIAGNVKEKLKTMISILPGNKIPGLAVVPAETAAGRRQGV